MTRTRLVTRAHVVATADVLADAFADDPVMTWLLAAAGDRAAARREFFRLLVTAARRKGHTYCTSVAGEGTERVVAGAVWLPPDVHEAFDDPDPILAFAREFVGGDTLDRMGVLTGLMGEHHPEEPAFYLTMLGVLATEQGRGLGFDAMEPVLRRCDHDGLPIYLESSNPRNIPFYERLGFEVISRFGPDDGVELAGMWRVPAVVSGAE